MSWSQQVVSKSFPITRLTTARLSMCSSVPGGWGTRREMKNDRLIAWIRERARQVTTLTSVCTGALLLGKAGLLDGKRATTHWRVLD